MTSEAQKDTELRCLAALAQQRLHPINLSSLQRRHHHNLEVCYQAPGKQLGFYQIKCWGCFGGAYKDCQEQRCSLCCRFFLIHITENLSGFINNPHQVTKDIMPVHSPLQDQNTTTWKKCSFTAWKNLYSRYEFPQELSCTILGKAISSCTCMGRKSE